MFDKDAFLEKLQARNYAGWSEIDVAVRVDDMAKHFPPEQIEKLTDILLKDERFYRMFAVDQFRAMKEIGMK